MQRRLRFNWFTVIMLVVVAYFSTILISQQKYLSHVNENQRIADQQLDKAKKINEALHKELAELQTDSKINQLARENLEMVGEGEILYQPITKQQ